MQPNGNVPGMGQPVAGAPVNNANVKPAPAPVPKPAEPAFGNGGSVVEGKGGKKTGWILGIVVLLLIAAGGVGFGVWAWMDGNTQVKNLNTQIDTLKKQNNDLQEQLTETIKQDETIVFWPASLVHSDQKIYMINESDEVVAVLETPAAIRDTIGCGQAVSENGADELLVCAGTFSTGEEFSFSYNTNDGTFVLDE